MSSPTIIIAGFSSTDKVPGAYGDVEYGAGGISAASIPQKLLIVGQGSAAATITRDTQVQFISDDADADTYGGIGSEAACMVYDAIAQQEDALIYMLCPAAAGGAVAATATITITGTPTASGTFEYRVAGQVLDVSVSTTDTVQTVATAIANAVNQALNGRLPVSAAVGAGPGYVVTLTCKSPGIRGNLHILFQNTSSAPTGMTSVLAGGTAVTGGGVPMTGGVGVETLTNALATIDPSQYDKIVIAQNDAASLAAWKTQIDAQATVLSNIRQHVIVAANGTLAAATSLAQTTLNDQRFQLLWHLNSETHPSRIAAAMGAERVLAESIDPAASYDGLVLKAVKGQSQSGDIPNHATLQSALNNSVTPITTVNGQAQVVRSITTHSLSGATPDYTTLDTSEAVVPDWILTDLQLYWTTVFRVSNPRVDDNPAAGEKRKLGGVATPDDWTSAVTGKLKKYEAGKIGTASNLPIIVDVDTNLPTSTLDSTAKRIVSAVPVVVAPGDHQIGISIRQM